MTLRSLVCGVLLLAGSARAGDDVLESLGEVMRWESSDGSAFAGASVTGELTGYHVELPPPGLLASHDDSFLAPRVMVTLDGGFGRLSLHVRGTGDRGFDPIYEEDGDARLDEYYLSLDVLDAARMQIRAGKFATVFGAWVERSLAWDNPLVSAPLLYDDMVTVTDAAAPASTAAFLARRDNPENKTGWLPVVWGQSYASGVSIGTGLGDVDLLIEVKNASLSSRPAEWELSTRGLDDGPTFTGRLQYRPSPVWTIGVSASDGPYLQDDAPLPPGADPEDFDQRALGLDVAFEHHALQVWAELAQSRYEVPNVGDADVTSGFVEARFKLAPRVWLAGRWNQSWFHDLEDTGMPWDRDVWRADLGVGFRQSAHAQVKLEYRYGAQEGTDTNGNHVVAAQLVIWF